MGLKKTENQVQVLLKDTILALCRNTLNYHAEICVEGLLCITLDGEEVLLVNINQIIENKESRKSKKRHKRNESSDDEVDSPSCKSKKKMVDKNKLEKECFKQMKDKPSCVSSPADYHNIENVIKKEPEEFHIKKESDNCDLLSSGDNSQKFWLGNSATNKEECLNRESGMQASLSREQMKMQQMTGHISGDFLPNLSKQVLLDGDPVPQHIPHNTAASFTPHQGTPGSSPGQHVCSICGKSFNWQWLLKRHQVVHSGDKDYSCEHCGRTFSYQSSVKRHQEKCATRFSQEKNSSKSEYEQLYLNENIFPSHSQLNWTQNDKSDSVNECSANYNNQMDSSNDSSLGDTLESNIKQENLS